MNFPTYSNILALDTESEHYSFFKMLESIHNEIDMGDIHIPVKEWLLLNVLQNIENLYTSSSHNIPDKRHCLPPHRHRNCLLVG
jgi:hypothetical protein